jgi:hypothetical protein
MIYFLLIQSRLQPSQVSKPWKQAGRPERFRLYKRQSNQSKTLKLNFNKLQTSDKFNQFKSATRTLARFIWPRRVPCRTL